MSGSLRPGEFRGLPSSLVRGGVLPMCVAGVLLCAIATATLGMMTAISNDYIVLSTATNVWYAPTQNGTVAPQQQQPILLIPQFNAKLGLLYFMVGTSSFSREKWNLLPMSPLQDSSIAVDPLLPMEVRNAYVKARSDALEFGYAASESCGGDSAVAIMSRCKFVVVAISFGIVCSAGTVVVAALLFVFITEAFTFSVENTTMIHGIWEVKFKNKHGKLKEPMKLLSEHKRRERNFVIALSVIIFIGTVFFIIAACMVRDLHFHRLKCRISFCEAHHAAMQKLFDLLPGSEYSTSCKTGYSFKALTAATILSAMACVFSFAAVCTHCMLSRVYVKVTCPTGGYGEALKRDDTSNPMELFSEIKGKMNLDNTFQDLAGPSTVPDFRETIVGGCYGDERGQSDMECTGEAPQGEISNGDSQRIMPEKDPHALVLLENTRRTTLCREQELDFSANVRWVKRKLWQGEYACLLHQRSLDWFFGPILDLHVEETFCRQKLVHSYCSRLLGKLERLKKESESCEDVLKRIEAATDVVRLNEHDLLGCVSHYAVDDDIYHCKPAIDTWPSTTDHPQCEAMPVVTPPITPDSVRFSRRTCSTYSTASVNVSSSDSLIDDALTRRPDDFTTQRVRCGNIGGMADNYFERKYAELIRKASRPSSLQHDKLLDVVRGQMMFENVSAGILNGKDGLGYNSVR
ncbi:hypothetical protein DQ04_02231020 [Trypanosoma grayi]|uniref:hypothetical protein n=1 Tax=Trypanosoma grayi TaxID=71804 RepID=UPI0004F49642|nr:hypothetical protein DQ04_02231020 [Trypanosoma grayi]KEG11833.1 hypothetical protein DQ04_02231020 [Trypanosoma grayi]